MTWRTTAGHAITSALAMRTSASNAMTRRGRRRKDRKEGWAGVLSTGILDSTFQVLGQHSVCHEVNDFIAVSDGVLGGGRTNRHGLPEIVSPPRVKAAGIRS